MQFFFAFNRYFTHHFAKFLKSKRPFRLIIRWINHILSFLIRNFHALFFKEQFNLLLPKHVVSAADLLVQTPEPLLREVFLHIYRWSYKLSVININLLFKIILDILLSYFNHHIFNLLNCEIRLIPFYNLQKVVNRDFPLIFHVDLLKSLLKRFNLVVSQLINQKFQRLLLNPRSRRIKGDILNQSLINLIEVEFQLLLLRVLFLREPRVLKRLFNGDPLGSLYPEHFRDQILDLRRVEGPKLVWEVYNAGLGEGIGVLEVRREEGRLGEEQEVEHDAEAPDVALEEINALVDLWRDVERRADLRVEVEDLVFVHEGGQAEVDELDLGVYWGAGQQNVFQLEVPVDYFLRVHVVHRLDQLEHDFLHLVLRHHRLVRGLHPFEEVPARAVLHHEVHVFSVVVRFVKFNYIRVIQFFQRVQLALQHLLLLHLLFQDGLYRYWLVRVLVVIAQLHCAETARSKQPCDLVKLANVLLIVDVNRAFDFRKTCFLFLRRCWNGKLTWISFSHAFSFYFWLFRRFFCFDRTNSHWCIFQQK